MSFNKIFKNKSILITGHTGFKGVWLSIWLESMGAKVFGISNNIPTSPSHFEESSLSSTINHNIHDICDISGLKGLFKECDPDFVFHLAAQPLVRQSYIDPTETWKTNTFGTINILESLRTLEKKCIAIFITSDKCYDNVEWVYGYKETDALGGPDPYSASKGAAEIAIRSYIKSFFPKDGKVKISIGRAGNVIGGGDWAQDRIVPDCISSWNAEEEVKIRNPHATRPWQHVLEPLSGYLRLAQCLYENEDLHGEPFNFGPPANQNNSVGELVDKIAENYGDSSWKDISEEFDGPYESGLLKLNCDKALHFLNWHAVWDFNRTVQETSDWYKLFYKQNVNSIKIKDFSLSQIDAYTDSAKDKQLNWTIDD